MSNSEKLKELKKMVDDLEEKKLKIKYQKMYQDKKLIDLNNYEKILKEKNLREKEEIMNAFDPELEKKVISQKLLNDDLKKQIQPKSFFSYFF